MSLFQPPETHRRPFRPFLRNASPFPTRATDRPIVTCESVYKSYGSGTPVLRGVDLRLERGEFVFVTGSSGAGKSTLLRLIYRADIADRGQVFFIGKDIARLTPSSIPFLRRNLGVVFQDFKLIPTWSVFENVAIALEVMSLGMPIIRTRVAEALDRVGLGGRGSDKVAALSGGEQQRVSIARAIVGEPALLLADEPTGNLDPHLALDLLSLFEEIHRAGTAVLFATHDRTLLEAAPHRTLLLEKGELFETSPHRKETPSKSYLS